MGKGKKTRGYFIHDWAVLLYYSLSYEIVIEIKIFSHLIISISESSVRLNILSKTLVHMISISIF